MSDKQLFTPFNDDGSNIIMPGQSDNKQGEDSKGIDVENARISDAELREKLSEQSILMSEGVEDAIEGQTVKSMLLKENENIDLPNFVLDLSNLDGINKLQMIGLSSLLHPDGNTAIYVYNKGKGLFKLGDGLNGLLNKILPRVVYNVLGQECKIYGDYQIGKKAKLITDSNITTKRMNI